MLSLHSSGIFSCSWILPIRSHRRSMTLLPRHFHTSAGISSGPVALPFFIFIRAAFTSSSCLSYTLNWESILKNHPWVFLNEESLIVLLSLSYVILLTEHIPICIFYMLNLGGLVALFYTFAILNIFYPSSVSNS